LIHQRLDQSVRVRGRPDEREGSNRNRLHVAVAAQKNPPLVQDLQKGMLLDWIKQMYLVKK